MSSDGFGFRRKRRTWKKKPQPAAEDAQPQAADGLPTVFWVPVFCPSCGARPGNTYKTIAPIRTRYHLCETCGTRFKSIEIPPSAFRQTEGKG